MAAYGVTWPLWVILHKLALGMLVETGAHKPLAPICPPMRALQWMLHYLYGRLGLIISNYVHSVNMLAKASGSSSSIPGYGETWPF